MSERGGGGPLRERGVFRDLSRPLNAMQQGAWPFPSLKAVVRSGDAKLPAAGHTDGCPLVVFLSGRRGVSLSRGTPLGLQERGRGWERDQPEETGSGSRAEALQWLETTRQARDPPQG